MRIEVGGGGEKGEFGGGGKWRKEVVWLVVGDGGGEKGRFGRSDEDKRGGRNFLRFGRGDATDYDVYENDELANVVGSEMDKRDRNFLRFGRGPNNNFLRFGRSISPLAYAQGIEMEQQPMGGEAEGMDSLISEEKRGGKNYLRFGRNNFVRNALRFGRSVDNQLACEGCQNDDMSANSPPATTNTRAKRAAIMPSEDNNNNNNDNDDDAKDLQRMKRNAMRFSNYNNNDISSYGPTAWGREYQPEDTITSDESSLEESMKKRNNERNFLRFGRNRNYLRFGKRDMVEDVPSDSSSSNDVSAMSPDEFYRYVRAQQKNFLRFG
ncbi:hypothetical protein Pcinc_039168 [Petrolisthes cinctipes]|uniref:Uncharacterized protein n=1 Tax=Petrolisthes cinctipes TaxID=88211 RepID=A0AAE1BP64_PETCI|nr:hypothetical protein Pcinc_039168 [Petrolisthes cinctipes]